MSSNWFVTLRSILELLFFVSGAVLAVVAVYGLKQLRLTKRIATLNAKRESVKFAAERCQYFGETTIPLHTEVTKTYGQHKPTCINNQKFEVKKGEIVQHNFDQQTIALCYRELSPISKPIVTYLNSMEAFAIPFVSGVADDEVGFAETAGTFCRGVAENMILIFSLRSRGGARYQSCVKLYECWSARLEAEKMKPLVQSMSDKIEAAEKAKLTPLDGA